MIITTNGRPAARFPLFKFQDGGGAFLLSLSRVDVSDVRNQPVAEAFYTPLFKRDARDGMETWEFHFFETEVILFFTQRGIQHHVHRNQRSEE